VDVEFSVFWRVKPNSVGDYLFNVANPASTVKAVAESAMRQVIGRSDAQPLLAGFQQTGAAVTQGGNNATPSDQAAALSGETAAQVRELMQKTLDSYKAGVLVQSVQIQTIQVPAKVIDSFRDVQAANSDLVRAQNEAQTYANRIVPEARGRAAKITQDAEAYREQTVAEATGQASRFSQIYAQYKNAPELTRERMYLETMERVFSATEKTIIDTGPSGPGVVPYLPLGSLPPERPAPTPQSGGNQ
jgi:modulator of FtsH protease HflK